MEHPSGDRDTVLAAAIAGLPRTNHVAEIMRSQQATPVAEIVRFQSVISVAEVVRLPRGERRPRPTPDNPVPKSHDFGYVRWVTQLLAAIIRVCCLPRQSRSDVNPKAFRTRQTVLTTALPRIAYLIVAASSIPGFANEQPAAAAKANLETHRNSVQTSMAAAWDFHSLSLFSQDGPTRFDMPQRPRVSRSFQPLRQVLLATGDRFVAECLSWGPEAAAFRLQSGTVIQVPIQTISRIANPPGEYDVLVDSFEFGPSDTADPKYLGLLDRTQAASGRSSLRIDSSSQGYPFSLEDPLPFARIEFSFRVDCQDPASDCGEWTLGWDERGTGLTVRLLSNGTIRVANVPPEWEPMLQTLRLSDGWHRFIAIMAPDRTRLIVDEAILATCATPPSSLKAIHFQPVSPVSKNQMWIDELQIRRIAEPVTGSYSVSQSLQRDMVVVQRAGELFGRIERVTEQAVVLETLGKPRPIPWKVIGELTWSQPAVALQQRVPSRPGLVARVSLQSFVDRPAWDSEQWTVTITSVETGHLVAHHALLGEFHIPWSEVSRIEPLFAGQTQLVDARHFHLGNAIRTDLNRHLPDGTELKGEFTLADIPTGRPYFSLEVAELEASGPDSPPASPYLAELRAGHLVTELFLNEQSLGSLNEHLRFKALAERPERIRIPIPRKLLKRGSNVFQLRQRPLKPGGREYDDGEVARFRLDFEN